MARQVGKVLQVARSKVVPEATPDIAPKVVHKTVALNLFDIDPFAEAESPPHIDLDLDQLEGSEE